MLPQQRQIPFWTVGCEIVLLLFTDHYVSIPAPGGVGLWCSYYLCFSVFQRSTGCSILDGPAHRKLEWNVISWCSDNTTVPAWLKQCGMVFYWVHHPRTHQAHNTGYPALIVATICSICSFYCYCVCSCGCGERCVQVPWACYYSSMSEACKCWGQHSWWNMQPQSVH